MSKIFSFLSSPSPSLLPILLSISSPLALLSISILQAPLLPPSLFPFFSPPSYLYNSRSGERISVDRAIPNWSTSYINVSLQKHYYLFSPLFLLPRKIPNLSLFLLFFIFLFSLSFSTFFSLLPVVLLHSTNQLF
jgi:hypothetical protein